MHTDERSNHDESPYRSSDEGGLLLLVLGDPIFLEVGDLEEVSEHKSSEQRKKKEEKEPKDKGKEKDKTKEKSSKSATRLVAVRDCQPLY